MDHAVVSLQSVLVVLASGVARGGGLRSLRLPPMVGYSSPASRSARTRSAWSRTASEIRVLAEIGVRVPDVLHRPGVQPAAS